MVKTKTKTKTRAARSARPVRPSCPKCRTARQVVPIQYGYVPPESIEQAQQAGQDFELGGSVIDETSPRWFCRRCRHSFGRLAE